MEMRIHKYAHVRIGKFTQAETMQLTFFQVGLGIYLYYFGCRLPDCCYRQNKDYTQVQLQRERKIGEIWKTNYAPRA
jgi:hypothetical protein